MSTLATFSPRDIRITGIDTPTCPIGGATLDPRVTDPAHHKGDAFELLCASVKKDGIREPVKVVETPEGMFVVSGRRRVMAARESNIPVPCLVVPATDAYSNNSIANAFHHESPLSVKAEACAMAEAAGMKKQDIARLNGVRPATVSMWFNLHNLKKERPNAYAWILANVEAKGLNMEKAINIAKASESDDAAAKALDAHFNRKDEPAEGAEGAAGAEGEGEKDTKAKKVAPSAGDRLELATLIVQECGDVTFTATDVARLLKWTTDKTAPLPKAFAKARKAMA